MQKFTQVDHDDDWLRGNMPTRENMRGLSAFE